MALAALPLAALPLDATARSVRPLVLARDRSVSPGGALAELVPDGVVVRGSVVRVTGEAGAGATTVAYELAAAFTARGSGRRPSTSTARWARWPRARRGSPSNGSRWSGGFPPPAGPPSSPRCSKG